MSISSPALLGSSTPVLPVTLRLKLLEGFTKKYGVTRLVYFEPFGQIKNAICREKQIKNWRREKKLALIRTQNPKMRDLSSDFHR